MLLLGLIIGVAAGLFLAACNKVSGSDREDYESGYSDGYADGVYDAECKYRR